MVKCNTACSSPLGVRTLFILCHGGPFGNLAQCRPWHRMPHEPEDTAAKKRSGTFCRNGPEGASHKRCLTPFSPHRELQRRSVMSGYRGIPPADLELLRKFDTPTICNVVELFD